MSQPETRVTPDELRRHAGHLDAAAYDLDTVQQAAIATTPGMVAYGKLCVMVPALLSELQAPLVEGIAAAGRSVRETADALLGTASDYEFTDQTAAAALRKSGGQ